MNTKLYLLWHTYENEPGAEESKLIGIYSSEERAKDAIERLRTKPGFRDYPEGFEIYEDELDMTDWREGFAKPWDA